MTEAPVVLNPGTGGDTVRAEQTAFGKQQVVTLASADGTLLSGLALDTTVTAVTTNLGTDTGTPPSSGTGVRGWLRGIYDRLSNPLAVTGAFFQTTQPISGTVAVSSAPAPPHLSSSTDSVTVVQTGSITTDVTDRSARLVGHVTVDSAPVTAVTGAFFQATQPVSAVSWPLPTGAAKDSTLTDGTQRATVTVSNPTTNPETGLAKDATLTGGSQKSKIVSATGIDLNVDASGFLAIQSGGTPGAAAPTRAIQMAGSDGTLLRTVKVSATGVISVDGSAATQPISAAGLPLPVGASKDSTLTDATQKAQISSNTGLGAFVKSTATDGTEPGLVVRVASSPSATANIRTAGSDATPANPLPTQGQLLASNGLPVATTNRLPVDIGGATVQATFTSTVSTANSTQTPLAANATFTGAWEDVKDFAAITGSLVSDQPSATNGLIAEFALDAAGTLMVANQTSTYPGGGLGAYFAFPPEARYVRIRYINGATAQTYLRSQTAYEFSAPTQPQQALGGPLTDANIGGVVRSILTGRLSTGAMKSLTANAAGELSVVNATPVSPANAFTTGTLGAASAATASQSYSPAASATAVQLAIPSGHSSWQITLNGTFSAASQVFFEGSETGADSDWFSLNGRRTGDATTNAETTLIDNKPTGGPSPQGSGVSYWRGSAGSIGFLRVRCGTYTAADAIAVRITSSVGIGATFPNAPAPLPSDNYKSAALTAAGQTVEVPAAGSGAWSSIMIGNFTGTVYFEQTVDGVTYAKINGAIAGVGTLQTQFTGTGTANQTLSVRGGSGGIKAVRLRAGVDFVGTFTGTLRAGAGTGGVFLTAPVPIAGLSNGAQTLRQSVGVTAVQVDPSALATRTSVEVKYHANGATAGAYVYVGFTSAVGTGTGRELSAGESLTLDVTTASQIWAIATAAAQPVQVTEIG
jgi:hypothetical protein